MQQLDLRSCLHRVRQSNPFSPVVTEKKFIAIRLFKGLAKRGETLCWRHSISSMVYLTNRYTVQDRKEVELSMDVTSCC